VCIRAKRNYQERVAGVIENVAEKQDHAAAERNTQRPFQETLLGKENTQRPFQETLLGNKIHTTKLRL
jgi:hypothetical protein